MNLKLIFSSLLVTLTMAACTSDMESDIDQMQSSVINELNGNKDSEEFANNCMSRVFPQTRGTDLEVEDVQLHIPRKTRAQNPAEKGLDTIVAVNYAYNKGFVMYGKKKGLKKMIAISEEGRFQFADTAFNRGLKFYIKNLCAHDVEFLSLAVAKEPEITKHPPVLNQNVRNWDQTSPYNCLCPWLWCSANNKYEQAFVGCVPLSVGMVMTHYEWPNANGSVSFDWQAIKSNPYSYINGDYVYRSIASLVFTLGSQDNLKTTYGVAPEGSPTRRKNVIPVLKKWGYSAPGDWSDDWPYKYVSGKEEERKPILICGTDKDNPSEGHQWVVDGSMYVDHFENNNNTATHTDRYLYFVWGWGGLCNAYYLAGSTTPNYGWTDKPFGQSVSNTVSFVNLVYYGDFTPNK